MRYFCPLSVQQMQETEVIQSWGEIFADLQQEVIQSLARVGRSVLRISVAPMKSFSVKKWEE
jgi:hypothetical protein